jgi:hypothetical protein
MVELPPVLTVARHNTGAVAEKAGTAAVSEALPAVAVGAPFVPFRQI